MHTMVSQLQRAWVHVCMCACTANINVWMSCAHHGVPTTEGMGARVYVCVHSQYQCLDELCTPWCPNYRGHGCTCVCVRAQPISMSGWAMYTMVSQLQRAWVHVCMCACTANINVWMSYAHHGVPTTEGMGARVYVCVHSQYQCLDELCTPWCPNYRGHGCTCVCVRAANINVWMSCVHHGVPTTEGMGARVYVCVHSQYQSGWAVHTMVSQLQRAWVHVCMCACTANINVWMSCAHHGPNYRGHGCTCVCVRAQPISMSGWAVHTMVSQLQRAWVHVCMCACTANINVWMSCAHHGVPTTEGMGARVYVCVHSQYQCLDELCTPWCPNYRGHGCTCVCVRAQPISMSGWAVHTMVSQLQRAWVHVCMCACTANINVWMSYAHHGVPTTEGMGARVYVCVHSQYQCLDELCTPWCPNYRGHGCTCVCVRAQPISMSGWAMHTMVSQLQRAWVHVCMCACTANINVWMSYAHHGVPTTEGMGARVYVCVHSQYQRLDELCTPWCPNYRGHGCTCVCVRAQPISMSGWAMHTMVSQLQRAWVHVCMCACTANINVWMSYAHHGVPTTEGMGARVYVCVHSQYQRLDELCTPWCPNYRGHGCTCVCVLAQPISMSGWAVHTMVSQLQRAWVHVCMCACTANINVWMSYAHHGVPTTEGMGARVYVCVHSQYQCLDELCTPWCPNYRGHGCTCVCVRAQPISMSGWAMHTMVSQLQRAWVHVCMCACTANINVWMSYAHHGVPTTEGMGARVYVCVHSQYQCLDELCTPWCPNSSRQRAWVHVCMCACTANINVWMSYAHHGVPTTEGMGARVYVCVHSQYQCL